MEDGNGAQALPLGKALLALPVVVVGVAAFIGVHMMLGIDIFYPGFLLLLFIGSLKKNVPAEWAPALVGALAGILTGALVRILPEQYDTAGMVMTILLVLGLVYGYLIRFLPIVINDACMLYLTVTTIPVVTAKGEFVHMACSVLIGAAVSGAMMLASARAAARKAVVKTTD